MNYFLPFFLIIGISCTPKDQNNIILPNNVILKRFPGEYIKHPSDNDIEYYESHFNNLIDYQIPLFKIFVHEEYKLYLGIPFENNNLDIFNIRTRQLTDLKNNCSIDSIANNILYNIKQKYIIENYYNIEDHSYFISFIETLNDSLAKVFYTRDGLKERFLYKP